MYTIGLGYGTDRTYLQELSVGTNARNYESPAPEQLLAIYSELATLLRSQYVITLNLDLPADGTEYTLGLQVSTDGGISVANATLRTPIPVPIIGLTLPTDPISAPTTITADVRGDDEIEGVNFVVSDTEIGSLLDAEPYTFTIDPVAFAPGEYTLAVSALDSTGDIGTAGGTFTIAALPPVLTFTPDLAALGTLSEPVTVAIEGSGQTPLSGVSVQFDGGEAVELAAPYTFIIDPTQFTPGDHTITVNAINEGGETVAVSGAFTAAALPPAIVINGLQDGQSVDRPVDITVTVEGQVPVSNVVVTVGGQTLEPTADNSYTIDPMTLVPGGTTITVNATLENGQSGSTSLNFLTAALPPQIFISGLTPGEVLDASREIEINANSQTTVVHVAVLLDETEVGHFTALPIPVTLDVLALGAGDHNLRIIADNASGQSSTLDVPFSVSAAPIATATQIANASATAVQATQIVQATAAAVQATEFANSTATQVQATSNAISTVNAQATLAIEATATKFAGQTATVEANATATQVAVLQVTQQFVDQQVSTQAAIDQNATNIARSTLDAAATEFAQATSTQVAAVTRGAQATGTVEAGATATAGLTATQNANATATQSAIAQATQEANASATAAAEAVAATQTSDANATQAVDQTATAQNTVAARETARAQIGATNQVETRSALETRAAQTRLEVQQTQDARSTRDIATQSALETQNAVETETALNAQTATQAALETQNAVETEAALSAQTATQSAVETQNAVETEAALNAQTATQSAVETQNAVETETALNAQTATQAAVETENAVQTATQAAVETQNAALTEEALIAQTEETLVAQAATATVETANADATEAAAQTATEAAREQAATETSAGAATQAAADQATSQAGATATSNANATIEIRLSAVGPTPTPIDGGAQSAPTATPETSPVPTSTLVPQQTETAPFGSSIIPIVIIALVLIILLIVIVLILRRR